MRNTDKVYEKAQAFLSAMDIVWRFLFRLFVGGVFTTLGLMIAYVLATDKSAWELYMLPVFAFLMCAVGLWVLFPQTIGARIERLLAKVFSPIGKQIKKWDLGKKAKSIFENRYFLAAFFIAFGSLYWPEIIDPGKEEKLFSIIAVLFFYAMGVYSLAPKVVMLAGQGVLWLVGIGILIAVGTIVFKGIAALPVSVAIILGAVIIASALKR